MLRSGKQNNSDMVEELVADSIFEDGHIESRNNDKLSGSKSVPMTLGAGSCASVFEA